MDLTEFLAARLDEDESAAQEAHYEGQRWLTEDEGVYRWPDDELVHSADRKSDARHIARHDPARVLREVEAKRAIIAVHVPWTDEDGDHFRDPQGGLECAICITVKDGYAEQWGADPWPCLPVRAIAAVYSDHPDYRAEWKPLVVARVPGPE